MAIEMVEKPPETVEPYVLPKIQGPDWVKETGDMVRVLMPDVTLVCQTCGTTRLVWGEYRRTRPLKPRMLQAAYCGYCMPEEWHGHFGVN